MTGVPKKHPNKIDEPPRRSQNIFTDIKYFVFHKPKVKTFVDFHSVEERNEIGQRILQRTGVGVDSYGMLNMHKIGIEAPSHYVFDEVMKWNGDSRCWPNHIANVELKDKKMKKIHVYLFSPFRFFGKIFGIRLFDMKINRMQTAPKTNDLDNARYILYNCSGGYPIGIFSMYVRSSIAEFDEKEISQLFIVVGFNFFGNQRLTEIKFMRGFWRSIHNRVTANVACRFKRLCEWQFEELKNE